MTTLTITNVSTSTLRAGILTLHENGFTCTSLRQRDTPDVISGEVKGHGCSVLFHYDGASLVCEVADVPDAFTRGALHATLVHLFA